VISFEITGKSAVFGTDFVESVFKQRNKKVEFLFKNQLASRDLLDNRWKKGFQRIVVNHVDDFSARSVRKFVEVVVVCVVQGFFRNMKRFLGQFRQLNRVVVDPEDVFAISMKSFSEFLFHGDGAGLPPGRV